LKVSTVRQDLMSDDSEFQVRGATTENARKRARFAFLGQSAAGRRMTAGVEEDIVLNVSDTTLYVTRCLTGSLWSDLRSGLASVRPSCWQTNWLSCSEPAAVRRKSRPEHRRAWCYSSPIWKRQYCKPLSEPSRQLAECAQDAGRVW